MSTGQLSLNAAHVRRALLGWFRRNARPLPWRKTRDPYAIWVSEVMLQQTQVAAVIPFYRRFLRAFPTVRDLAHASEERAFKYWSGLGYYRRARNLRLAARIVTHRFRGHFPRDYRQARELPGVGDYTARAVLSIAYNLPYYVLDGNVARVMARLGALRGHANQARFRRAVDEALARLLSQRKPGRFNQALMELGQTVCLPRAPRCPACPLRSLCRAFRRGNPESFPVPRPRRVAEGRDLATGVIRVGQDVALVRGLDEGLLGGLWNFPAAFGLTREEARRHLRQKLSALLGDKVRLGRALGEIRHRITFRAIVVQLYPVSISEKASQNDLRWFRLLSLRSAPVSQLARKVAAVL